MLQQTGVQIMDSGRCEEASSVDPACRTLDAARGYQWMASAGICSCVQGTPNLAGSAYQSIPAGCQWGDIQNWIEDEVGGWDSYAGFS